MTTPAELGAKMIQMGWGGFGLHHQTWECQDDGVGRCGGRRIPLWRLKRIGNWLAVHMRVQHPRCIRSGVTVDGRRHSTHGQPEIYNLISRKSAQVVVGRCDGIHISQSGSWVTGGGSNARATGEVLTVEQSSNNDTGDVENTIQVLAESKKQQREAPFKAPQMDAPVQYTVLAEIPATNPADAHSTKKFGLHQPRPSPDSPSSVTSCSTTATTSRPRPPPPPPLPLPSGVMHWCSLAPCCIYATGFSPPGQGQGPCFAHICSFVEIL
jgi:hypothetical protein